MIFQKENATKLHEYSGIYKQGYRNGGIYSRLRPCVTLVKTSATAAPAPRRWNISAEGW
jgi:hypothetical protein